MLLQIFLHVELPCLLSAVITPHNFNSSHKMQMCYKVEVSCLSRTTAVIPSLLYFVRCIFVLMLSYLCEFSCCHSFTVSSHKMQTQWQPLLVETWGLSHFWAVSYIEKYQKDDFSIQYEFNWFFKIIFHIVLET